MTEEDGTSAVERHPAEADNTSPYTATQQLLPRLDDYQIRVVLAFAQELLRD